MSYKSPIIIVNGEPNSIFLEIFFKSLKYKKYKSPIILISSLNLVRLQMKKLNFKSKIKLINYKKINNYKLNNKEINLININYKQKKAFEKITKKSNKFIKNSFQIALDLVKKKFTNKVINGPISKKHFLNKKFLGITEYLTKKSKSTNTAMLIYNKELSVCPLTTHLPLKKVSKIISKNLIREKIILIDKFYRKKFKFKPKIAILGLNPHCETIDNLDEDKTIIKPVVKQLKKQKYKVNGPFPADTIFLKKNRKNYNVIVGMYHDQVLTPIKTIFEYDAINITLGLPFLRVTPDHGPNVSMLGKNKSSAESLIKSILFLDKN